MQGRTERPLRAVLISDSPPQRHRLQNLLEQDGIEVVLSQPPEVQVLGLLEQGDIADLLLLDLDEHALDDEFLAELFERSPLPILVNDRATQGDGDTLSRWSEKLLAKIHGMAAPSAEGEPRAGAKPSAEAERPVPEPGELEGGAPVEPIGVLALDLDLDEEIAAGLALEQGAASRVWVLGASLGGPQAVKRFLAALPPDLPIGFMLAQHIGAAFLPVLAQILSKEAHYRVLPPEVDRLLKHGEVVLAPVEHSLRLLPSGRIDFGPAPTEGFYRPSVDEVMIEVARCYGEHCGAIVFSGLGNDGAKGCRVIAAAGGVVWAQVATSCVNSSMPDAARGTGVVRFSADPEGLAANLVAYLEVRS